MHMNEWNSLSDYNVSTSFSCKSLTIIDEIALKSNRITVFSVCKSVNDEKYIHMIFEIHIERQEEREIENGKKVLNYNSIQNKMAKE